MAHIPPLRGWFSRDSLCYGVGARMEYINAKMQKCKMLTVDVSNARTKLWHDRIRDCWLMLIRMSGWTAPRETTHLLPGSSKRPDIRAHIAGRCVLFDVRTYTMTSGMGPAGLSHCAATPGHAAACGAAAKHKAWDARAGKCTVGPSIH